ncbi:MAG: hypothetical protein ACKO23_10475, partial [Gemmataceae bacterium]
WTDREKRSRTKSFLGHWMTPIVVDGHLYGSSGRNAREAELRCLELATGKVKWREPGLTRCSLLLAEGQFICLGEDGMLTLFKANPDRFEKISQVLLRDAGGEPLLDYPAWAAPILSHGLLFVRGEKYLVCLDLKAKNNPSK